MDRLPDRDMRALVARGNAAGAAGGSAACGARAGAARAVPARAVLPLLLIASLAGCTFTPKGVGLSDAASAGASAPDPVDVAARSALLGPPAPGGVSRWREDETGSQGTVRALGAVDREGCIPARLTVHDYTGLRVEERRLCPGAGAGDDAGDDASAATSASEGARSAAGTRPTRR